MLTQGRFNKMKSNLYLIGTGEFAREIESWISLDKTFLKKWRIMGFLGRDLNAIHEYPSDFSVVGIAETFDFQPGDAALLCIANPIIKKRIADAINKKVEFISYISNYTTIAKFTKIGKGVVICPNCIISTNCIIADYVTVNCGCIVGHDCSIAEYSSLMPHVDLGGHVKIGKGNFLGTKTTVIPGRVLNDRLTIGAGSVVVRNLTKEGTYFGNPCSLLKF